MISVLIPTYNYHITDLVLEIHRQLVDGKLEFEIICLEDGSNENYIKQNSTLKNLSNTNIIVSKTNKGRIKSRQILSEQAKYEWLLFLDSDVMPKRNDFVTKYIEVSNLKHEVVYGGICYNRQRPNKSYILRWKYGMLNEEVSVEKRIKHKYRHAVSANMLIKTELFKSLNSKIELEGYGLDNYFASLLIEQESDVHHIDNEVYHLGIEKSEDYLNKKEMAAINLLKLYKIRKINDHDNSLLSVFINLKRFQLHYLFSGIYKVFKSPMKQNLLGTDPSISLLQFYRISFMCYISLKGKY